MRPVLLGLLVAGLCATPARAADLEYRPIDTSKYLIQPTDQATGFLANATRALSRATAGVIESNGYVKTINSLLGETKSTPAPQANGLPSPSLYPSSAYPNSFQPRMPTSSRRGR